MKKALLLLLSLTILLFPTPSYAADEIWTCISGTETYCDQDHGPASFVQKGGCVIADQFKKQCADIEKGGEQNGSGDTCFSLHTAACVCEFKQLSNTCTTSGGVKDAETDVTKVFGKVNTPSWIAAIGVGEKGLTNLLQKLIELIYIVSMMGFVFMVLWGGFQMITSGGGKEGLAAARQRITWAIIGIILLAVAFPIFRLIEGFTGFKIFS